MILAEYHPDWNWISRQIRDQAGNRCEFCGLLNHERGARDRHGDWWSEERIERMEPEFLFDLFSNEWPKLMSVVLTTAHLNHDKRDNDPCNLRALCQKCHLNWDRKQHIENRKRNQLARSGQQVMF